MQIGQRFNPFKLFVGSFIPNCIGKISELSPTAKLVYARLAQYAGESGECFPSLKAIAEETGSGRRTVVRSIQELEKYGFLRILPRTKAGGGHSSNAYVFLWHRVYQNEAEGGAKMAPPCKNGTRGGAKMAPLICSLRESGVRESKDSEAEASPPILEDKHRSMTPLQKVVMGFKIASGIPADDKAWDKTDFAKTSGYAKELLIYFNQNVDIALHCIEDIATHMNKNGLSWSPAAICRWKADWQAQVVVGKYMGIGKAALIVNRGGEDNGR